MLMLKEGYKIQKWRLIRVKFCTFVENELKFGTCEK